MLDNKTYKILKRIYRRKEIPVEQIHKMAKHTDKNRFCPEETALTSNGFTIRIEKNRVNDGAGGSLHSDLFLRITPKGKAYVEETRRTRFHFWIPTAIAVASLLVSVFALLRP